MTMEVSLTRGYTAIIDDEDADLLQFKWHAAMNNRGGNVYAKRSIGHSGHASMHQIILERKLGRPLATGELPDHADRNSLNNRRDNLRILTKRKNTWNRSRRSDNKSGLIGVVPGKYGKGWQANIADGSRQIYLGTFATKTQAAFAYDEAAIELRGHLAVLNFPE